MIVEEAMQVIERHPAAAKRLRIVIVPNLTGVAVRLDEGGPSPSDPLEQCCSEYFFATIEEAVDRLPELARAKLHEALCRGKAPLDLAEAFRQ